MNKIEVRKIIKNAVELLERIDVSYDFHFNHCGSYMKVEVIGVMPEKHCMRERHRGTSFKYLSQVFSFIGDTLWYIIGHLSLEEINNIRNLINDASKIDSIEFNKKIDKYGRGEFKRSILYIREMLNRS